MKKIISLASSVMIVALLTLSSCGGETKVVDSWPESEKEAFMTECVKGMNEPGVDPEDYCSCMLDKVIEEYPTPEEALKITIEWMTKEAQGCI